MATRRTRRVRRRNSGPRCGEIGFAVLTGHGVDPALYDEMHDRSLELFTRPRSRKRCGSGPRATGRSPRAISRSRRPAKSIPTWSKGGCGAGARSICRSGATRRSAGGILARGRAIEPQFRELVARPRSAVQADRPGDAPGARLSTRTFMTRSSPERISACRAQLLSADERGSGHIGRRPVVRPRGRRFVHHPPGEPGSTGCRCGTTAAANGCGCSAPPWIDHHQYRRLYAADHERPAAFDHPPGRQADATARIRSAPRVSFPIAVYVWEDELLEVLPGPRRAEIPPIKAIAFHTRSTSKFYGDDYAVEFGLNLLLVMLNLIQHP